MDIRNLFSCLIRWIAPEKSPGISPGDSVSSAARITGPPEQGTEPENMLSGKESSSLQEILAGLERLIPALETLRPRLCKDTLRQLQNLSWPNGYRDTFDLICLQVSSYRFEEAMQQVKRLQSRMREDTAG
ncbi:MAG: hypothetical protein ABFD97_09530 [Syntrophobacter sp.]